MIDFSPVKNYIHPSLKKKQKTIQSSSVWIAFSFLSAPSMTIYAPAICFLLRTYVLPAEDHISAKAGSEWCLDSLYGLSLCSRKLFRWTSIRGGKRKTANYYLLGYCLGQGVELCKVHCSATAVILMLQLEKSGAAPGGAGWLPNTSEHKINFLNTSTGCVRGHPADLEEMWGRVV